MVVLFHVEAHFLHHRNHLGAKVRPGIDRRHREIAALGRRPVADVAFLHDLARHIGAFLGIEFVEARIHRHIEANVVENEEFCFRSEVRGIADAGGVKIGLGLLGHRPRVAAIGLASGRLHAVTNQDHRRLRGERVHDGGGRVRDQRHVGFVDRLPACDRRAVEHDAVGERILVDEFRRHGQVLPLATGVGKAQINEVYFVVLQGFQDVRWGLAIQ